MPSSTSLLPLLPKLKTIRQKLVWAEVDDKQQQAKLAKDMWEGAKLQLEKHQKAASQDMGPVK
jgi:hypothetical protein